MTPPTPLRPNLRDQWLLDPSLTFLNHGSFGSVPRIVFDAQTEWRRRIEADPIELLGRRAQELVAEAKRPVAAWLGMDEDSFGLVTNATEAVNAVLASVELVEGDELLTTSHVYHAVRQAMKLTAARRGATVREIGIPLPIQSADQVAQLILSSLSDRTRLVIIDHITSPTALVFPARKIIDGCAKRKIDVLVDGAHAPGSVPLNVPNLGAAYYTGNLHKWPCAPKGCAFLWARADRKDRIHPLVVSHHLGEGLSREFGWQGTRDLSAWRAMPLALEFMADLGWDAVMQHNHAMATWVQQMLCKTWGVEPISPLDGSMIGAMVTVALPPPLERLEGPKIIELQQRLHDEHRLEVPLVPWEGRVHVRPCCQVYNTVSDYERLSEVIQSVARTL